MNLNESRWGLLIMGASLIFQIVQVIQNRKPKGKRPKRKGRHR